MIPAVWPAVVLAFAVYRSSRLVGWDDMPLIVRARAWAVGEAVRVTGSSNAVMGLTSENPQMMVTYRRPTLAHFLSCPFCTGVWFAACWYGAWLLEPRWALYAAFPAALAAAGGLIAKNWDP